MSHTKQESMNVSFLSLLVIHSPLACYVAHNAGNLTLSQRITCNVWWWIGTWLLYKHMSVVSLTYVTRKFSYVLERICKSTTLIDLQILSRDTKWLARTHMLVVLAHRIRLVAWRSNHLALKPFWHSHIIFNWISRSYVRTFTSKCMNVLKRRETHDAVTIVVL